MWFGFLRFHVGQFFFFPHWREDKHAWTMALQHHRAFCKNFLFFFIKFCCFMSYSQWILVNDHPPNFQFFLKNKVFSKIINFGHFHDKNHQMWKNFNFLEGVPNDHFWSFSLSLSPCFWPKFITFVIFPKLFLVRNLPFLMVVKHEILVTFIGYSHQRK